MGSNGNRKQQVRIWQLDLMNIWLWMQLLLKNRKMSDLRGTSFILFLILASKKGHTWNLLPSRYGVLHKNLRCSSLESRFIINCQYYFGGRVESRPAFKATTSSNHVSTSILYILSLSILPKSSSTLPTYHAQSRSRILPPVSSDELGPQLGSRSSFRAVAALHQIWCLWGGPKAAEIFLESILSRSTICARGEDGGRGARSPSADLDRGTAKWTWD